VKSIKSIKQLIIAGLLLQSGINIAYNDKFAQEGQAIAKAVNSFASNRKEDSKLIIAAQKGNVKDLEAALNDPEVKVDEIGETSRKTALMLSCQNGHKRVVEILLGKGANPHVLSEWGCNSAVREAVKGGHIEILKLLLRNKSVDANFRLSLGYALIEAAIKGRNDMAKLLLESGVDPNVEGSRESNCSYGRTSALLEAVIEGHTSMVQSLLAKGADINMQSGETGATALMVAASKGDEAMIKLFLNKGADPNIRDAHGETALDYAQSERHRAIIQPFMSREYHLMSAVVKGDSKAVKDLIAAGANVNAGYKNGVTVLIEAAKRGNAEIVKILIDAGANVTGKDGFGFTALIRATEKGSAEIVKALIDGGAAQDSKSLETAYMMACRSRGSAEIAELLKPLIAGSSK
jgi:ankyrin repeat protein